jgi:hypothetical protein
VKEVWFDERRSNRSTRDSSQKIYRVLTSRLKSAPSALPNPSVLPNVLEACQTARDKAQVLSLYLIADDPLVRYVVHEYAQSGVTNQDNQIDLSDDHLLEMLDRFEYTDGQSFDYAESTTKRWCEGFRSVMREIGVLESQRTVKGTPAPVGDTPLLIALAYSYADSDDWMSAPRGLYYLFQPASRWDELYDRGAETDAWTYRDLHGELSLEPTEDAHPWGSSEVTADG